MLSMVALTSLRRVAPQNVVYRSSSSISRYLEQRTKLACPKGTITRYGQQVRKKSTEKKGLVAHDGQESGSEVSPDVKEIVRETTKTASYSAIILAGVGLTAVLFYVIFKELFSSKSPNNVYAKAVEKCLKDTRVLDTLGEPVKGFGEETRRGRRRHVSHVMYQKNGVPHMRMKFYLKGTRKSATVELEVKEDDSGNYVYRYLFVQLDDFPRRVIVLEDNRNDTPSTLAPAPPLGDMLIS